MKKTLSTVDTTRTTTATSSKTEATKGGVRVRTGPSVLSVAAAQWDGMTATERNSYAVLSGQMNDPLRPMLVKRPSAFNTFVVMTAANFAVAQPTPNTALPYTTVPELPDMDMHAAFVNKQFTLMLTPKTPYPHPIALRACRPLLASDNVTTATRFVKIGSIPQLSGTVDATALFNSRFHINSTGYQIALEVTGVAPGGFQTRTVLVTGPVTNVAAAQSEAAPEETQLHVG